MLHENAAEWQEAMREEYLSLQENQTWAYVGTSGSTGSKPIGCRWVFRTKINHDGSKRFKARLVIKGYEQSDFGETFAPVAKHTSLRMMLAQAALHQWEIDQMDVVTAFLNPPIDDEIYMQAPEGTDWLDPEIQEGSVCRLIKALYGLKQAPRLWYNHIDEHLRSMGFVQSQNDPTLYISSALVTENVYILLYVDDLLVASGSRSLVDQTKNLLSERYRMTDLGPAKQFLNIRIDRLINGSICLSQERFVDTILERFGMTSCNGVATPMEPGACLVRSTSENAEDSDICDPDQHTLYQSLVGSIMYLMTSTRPDLAFTISSLSKFLAKPTTVHLAAAKRVLRYLKQTKNYGLTYRTLDQDQDGQLMGFTDSDWAGDRDDRKSTSGYAFTLQGAAICWKSRKQTVIALSSTEAEYISCSEAAREAIWLQRLFLDLSGSTPDSTPMLLYADNQSAIKLSENPRFHERTKHIDIRYHFLRQAHENGQITVKYLATADMTADILTKSLPRDAHQRHTTGMGLIAVPKQ